MTTTSSPAVSHLIDEDHQLDDGLARAVIAQVIARQALRFASHADHDRDDLQQEALLAVHRAWPKYRRDKSAPSSFIYMVATRRLLTLARDLDRRRRRDRLGMLIIKMCTSDQGAEALDPKVDGLADWCASNYRTAKRMYGDRLYGLGEDAHSVARLAAVVLLQHRLGLDAETTADMLGRRPDLMRALHFPAAPDRGFVAAVEQLRPQADARQRHAYRRRSEIVVVAAAVPAA